MNGSRRAKAQLNRDQTDQFYTANLANFAPGLTADPGITLQAICERLQAMRARTTRGRKSWQPSSVKMLLERAERLGMN
jgi:hypothetical protein